MKIESAVFHSQLARRIMGLFLLCAAVPIVALAVVSLVQVRSVFADHARRELLRVAQDYTSNLHDRLVLRLLPENLELRLRNQARRLEEVDDELTHELRDRGRSSRALRRRAPITGHGRLSRHRSRLMT